LAADGVLKTIKPVTRNSGLEELGAAEAARSAAFEGVSLLGDMSTIEDGSQLNREVWRMQAMARGELPVGPNEWRETFRAYRQARTKFYRAARNSMGVPPAVIPTSSAWLEEADRGSGSDGILPPLPA
jgi:hypothetical protein